MNSTILFFYIVGVLMGILIGAWFVTWLDEREQKKERNGSSDADN